MDRDKEKVECCATCYYGRIRTEAAGKDKGMGGIFGNMFQSPDRRICRRYPPPAIPYTTAGVDWAYTFDQEWCGEYRSI